MLPGASVGRSGAPLTNLIPLSDDRLAALLDWIFTRFDNHTETHFTAEEVAAGRAAPFVDPKAARAALE